jgi:predicted dehydrogenase
LVGCNTRFIPSFKLVKELIGRGAIGKVLSVKISCGFYLPYWHPGEDYRKSYSARRELGGGVIFDDIHEIDSLYWLFGKPKELFCFSGRVSDLKIDTEDLAEIFMRFKSGIIAQVHLDYLQRTYRRNYEFIGDKGLILWDYISENVELFSAQTDQKKVFQENINISREKMFIDEMEHFVNCIKGKEKSINGLRSAIEIFKIAHACHESAKKKGIVYL